MNTEEHENFSIRYRTSKAILDCGGKRSATPLFERTKEFFRSLVSRVSESGVAAALCHRSPDFYPCLSVSIRGSFFVSTINQ
jgi:uncharacterized membrane protein YfbV (UPF0208 family)